MAVDVGFYHCTRDPLAVVAVRLAAKVLGSGQRLLVVGPPDRLDALDRALWEQAPDSFLAHGMAGGRHDAHQPILLALAAEPGNGARLLMLAEAGLPATFGQFDRVLHLFEDASPALLRARADWKALADREGVARSYWQQTARSGWEERR